MAVGPDYDGASIEPRLAKGGGIRVTAEWLRANATDKSDAAEDTMNKAIVGQSICPAMYTFTDTPEVRCILGLSQRDVNVWVMAGDEEADPGYVLVDDHPGPPVAALAHLGTFLTPDIGGWGKAGDVAEAEAENRGLRVEYHSDLFDFDEE